MWPSDLKALKSSINRIKKEKIAGIFLEAGVALGGSAIYVSSVKNKETPFYLYDVYDMIPPPSEKDDKDVHDRYNKIVSGKSSGINGNVYYGYQKDLLEVVKNNFKNFKLDSEENNIHFVKGKFQDEMKISEKIAFAHLDCDWYESVKYCLEEIHPNLSKGGEILIDDYFHYSGCKKAVDEFLDKNKNQYKSFKKAKLHLIKV
jgi:asparagine synthase (glutamine-hydrolysing)